MKNSLKKYSLILLMLVLASFGALTGCSGGDAEEPAEESGAAVESAGQTGEEPADDFDILAGSEIKEDGDIVYLYGNDFLLTMPNTVVWDIDQTSNDAFSIFLTDARESDYGGELVTIKAYDIDDTSYEELPAYHIAGVGQNVNKRFIAIYPTDVRWDPSDSEQEAAYRDLSGYLDGIEEGAADSPFQTADSD